MKLKLILLLCSWPSIQDR